MDDCVLAMFVTVGSTHHAVEPKRDLIIAPRQCRPNSREGQPQFRLTHP
jgi:hypothetical protein